MCNTNISEYNRYVVNLQLLYFSTQLTCTQSVTLMEDTESTEYK